MRTTNTTRAALLCIAVLLVPMNADAQTFVPFPGDVSVVTDGPGGLRSLLDGPSTFRTAVAVGWNASRAVACDELRSQLGRADRIAKGVTAYNIKCEMAGDGELSINAAQSPFGQPMELRWMVRGNALDFTTTTGTVLGRYADPDFAVSFDLELLLRFAMPSSPGAIRVQSVTATPSNSRLSSQNFIADLGFALNDVSRIFGGSDFVAMAQRMIDAGSINLTDEMNTRLEHLNSILSAAGPGGIIPALDQPGTTDAGKVGGRTLPKPASRGAQLVLVHRPWTLRRTPADPRTMYMYAASANGDMYWYRRDGRSREWTEPRRIGSGWGGFSQIMHAGGSAFYGLTPEGVLKWYRHDGISGGTADWQGPRDVATGWQHYRRIFAAPNGVFYAVQQDGSLLWFRHEGAADGSNRWVGPRQVGSAWGDFAHVISGHDGVIYALRRDGRLAWYRHEGHDTGEARWSGPVVVATGWTGYRDLMSVGDGVILATRGDGRMIWLRHRHHLTAAAMRETEIAKSPGRTVPQTGQGRTRDDAIVRQGPPSTSRAGQRPAAWDEPTEIGSGWMGLRALVPVVAVPRVIETTPPRIPRAP